MKSTGEPRWIESALGLAQIMIDEFADAEQGGFFFTGNRHEALIARQKDMHDNATPSGNGMAATALVRLGALTGRDDLTRAGRSALESVQSVLERQPAAAGQSLIALDFLLGSIREFAVIAGDDPAEFRVGPGSDRDAVPPAQGRRSGHARAGGYARRKGPIARQSARPRRQDHDLCLRAFHVQRTVVGVEGVEEALGRTHS